MVRICALPALSTVAADDIVPINDASASSETKKATVASILKGAANADFQTVLGGHPGNAIAPDLIGGTIAGGGTANRENVIGGQYDNVDTGVTNLPTITGTNAGVSAITGGYDNVANGLMSMIGGAHNRTHQDSTHGTISGGSVNSIRDGDYSTIVGGTQNNVNGSHSTVGGRENECNAANSTVFGNGNDVAVSADGSVALGMANDVNVQGAAIGNSCIVDGINATALGRRSRVRTYGQVAQACDHFATPGDAQTSVVFLKIQTTNGTETAMAAPSGTHSLLASQVVAYRITLVAREDATGDCKMWTIDGAMKRPASGNNTHVGGAAPTPVVVVADAGAAAWTCRMDISTALMALRVTGEAAHTIRWGARVELTEIANLT